MSAGQKLAWCSVGHGGCGWGSLRMGSGSASSVWGVCLLERARSHGLGPCSLGQIAAPRQLRHVNPIDSRGGDERRPPAEKLHACQLHLPGAFFKPVAHTHPREPLEIELRRSSRRRHLNAGRDGRRVHCASCCEKTAVTRALRARSYFEPGRLPAGQTAPVAIQAWMSIPNSF